MAKQCLWSSLALVPAAFVHATTIKSTPEALNTSNTNIIPNGAGPVLYYNGTGPVPSYFETSPDPLPITPLTRWIFQPGSNQFLV